jgi:transposase-like protein
MDHVHVQCGTYEEKRRLEVILKTLHGEMTVAEACAELGIGESRFHEIRNLALEGALDALRPGRGGRPRKDAPTPEEVEELRRKVRELKWELTLERTQNEVDRIMLPSLQGKQAKKGAGRAKVRRRSGKKARR